MFTVRCISILIRRPNLPCQSFSKLEHVNPALVTKMPYMYNVMLRNNLCFVK